MSDALEPCPWCSTSSASRYRRDDDYWIGCLCGARSSNHSTMLGATVQWNRLSVAVREREAMRAVVEAAGRCAEWFQHPAGCALKITPSIDECDCGIADLVHALKVHRFVLKSAEAEGRKT